MITVLSSADLDKGAESFSKVWAPTRQIVTPTNMVIMRMMINLLQPPGYVMHHQFNIQQLYALSKLYLCVLYLSENKQQLVPLTS
jgi:hypothetical protein